jgi:hypothetical protein
VATTRSNGKTCCNGGNGCGRNRSNRRSLSHSRNRKKGPPSWTPTSSDTGDKWATALINKRLEGFAEMMGKETGAIEKRIRDDFRAELDALRQQVNELRGERKDNGVVDFDLANWRSWETSRDAAQ